jgi:phosphoribosylaminoimidazolecarboxamide formyltransferase/IMP cyclohydrolase
MKIARALISVSDKNGLSTFAQGLHDLGVELISTAGTATFLESAGLPVTRVEELTQQAELLDGRVKSLHPAVFAGILARRDKAEDMASLREQGIAPIDMVVSNLYPFRSVAGRRGVPEAEVLENIDIGGPAMVRAAAKNHHAVAVVTEPERYGFLLDELRSRAGELSADTRRELAADAFSHTASYDAAIATWFTDTEPFPERLTLDYLKVTDLAYGENPHQRAAFYRDAGARRNLLSRVEQHGGPQLSFNNLGDLQAARTLAAAFQVPAAIIIKHGIPSGVAVGATPGEAFEGALATDPDAAFGGVIAVNRPVSAELAAAMTERKLDVLFAPGYEDGALEVLQRKESLRILEDKERRKASPGERDVRRVLGGLLVQDRDMELDERETMSVVTEASPSKRQWDDLLFAWRVAHFVRSNAIVLARDLATVGIGAGQVSRVDAVRLAIGKAGDRAAESVMASDAFFPFEDGPKAAFEAGVTAVIQPGGSVRDDEIIATANAAGIAMVFTGRRHFVH